MKEEKKGIPIIEQSIKKEDKKSKAEDKKIAEIKK